MGLMGDGSHNKLVYTGPVARISTNSSESSSGGGSS